MEEGTLQCNAFTGMIRKWKVNLRFNRIRCVCVNQHGRSWPPPVTLLVSVDTWELRFVANI